MSQREPAELHPRHYLLIVAMVVVAAVGVTGGWTWNTAASGRLAPVPLSGSISFDEKMEWLWKGGERRWDVLAVGSSMTLNNLDGATVAAGLPRDAAFVNAASWSMKIADSQALIDYVAEVREPRAVLLVTGPMDFYGAAQGFVRREQLDTLRTTTAYPLLVARHFDPLWYWQRADAIGAQRADRSWYTSLRFDDWGCVPLDVRWPAVAEDRWNERPRLEQVSDRQYTALAAIADRLAARGTLLVCAQAPIRADAVAACGEDRLRAHWARLEAILAARGLRFHNLHDDLALGVEAFADYSHLNADGARRFSAALMERCGDDLRRALAR